MSVILIDSGSDPQGTVILVQPRHLGTEAFHDGNIAVSHSGMNSEINIRQIFKEKYKNICQTRKSALRGTYTPGWCVIAFDL